MKEEYVTLSGLKTEYGLTDKLIKSIGAPNAIQTNPYYKNASPTKLYLKERINCWISEHQKEIVAAQVRKDAANKAANTKRRLGRTVVAKVVQGLKLRPIGTPKSVERQAREFFFSMYEDFNGEVTEKGKCAFIRHNFTNYEEILSVVKGKVGASELYENVKVYLCCRIVDHYDLSVDPLYAAFGEAALYNEIPDRFIVPDGKLRSTVATLLGIKAVRKPKETVVQNLNVQEV